MFCNKCHRTYNDENPSCPYCGNPQNVDTVNDATVAQFATQPEDTVVPQYQEMQQQQEIRNEEQAYQQQVDQAAHEQAGQAAAGYQQNTQQPPYDAGQQGYQYGQQQAPYTPPQQQQNYGQQQQQPYGGPPPYQQQPPYASNEPMPGKGAGIASLVCGIIGFLIPFFGIVLSIIALVLGNSARKILPDGQRGLATAGWICGIIGTVLWAVVLVIFFATIGVGLSMLSCYGSPYSYYW
ncbi:MAG: DUF4190 domain-containing protein [Christensenellaceae bacterium]|jgi:hypothetical protein